MYSQTAGKPIKFACTRNQATSCHAGQHCKTEQKNSCTGTEQAWKLHGMGAAQPCTVPIYFNAFHMNQQIQTN